MREPKINYFIFMMLSLGPFMIVAALSFFVLPDVIEHLAIRGGVAFFLGAAAANIGHELSGNYAKRQIARMEESIRHTITGNRRVF